MYFHSIFSAVKPTTFAILWEFRIVVTGVVYQIIFQRRLTRKQWFSLILLTIGCILGQLGDQAPKSKTSSSVTMSYPKANGSAPVSEAAPVTEAATVVLIDAQALEGGIVAQLKELIVDIASSLFDYRLALVMLQIFSSCFGGVYMELLIKVRSDSGLD